MRRNVMAMRNRILLATAVASVLLLGAAIYRCIQVAPYPIGGGQHLASPDGAFEAHVADFHDKDFWGRRRNWYEFELIDKSSRNPVRLVRMDCLPGRPIFQMRSGGKIISWSPDSSEATFAFQGIALTLRTKP